MRHKIRTFSFRSIAGACTLTSLVLFYLFIFLAGDRPRGRKAKTTSFSVHTNKKNYLLWKVKTLETEREKGGRKDATKSKYTFILMKTGFNCNLRLFSSSFSSSPSYLRLDLYFFPVKNFIFQNIYVLKEQRRQQAKDVMFWILFQFTKNE